MWVTRVSSNKPLSEFPARQEVISMYIWNLYQASNGMDAISITEENADISIKSRGRERLWSTLDLAKSYLVFLKNHFDNNSDGIVFTSTLEEECWSDNSPSAVRIENPVKLETYQSIPN